MRKIFVVCSIALALMIGSVGCTKNAHARVYGGTETIKLEPGQKLINATWKETDLWILTRDMHDGEAAESYRFSEDSSFGVLEGTVNFVESKR